MSLADQIAALPEWPAITRVGFDHAHDADYWCDSTTAALARLALAREWVEEAGCTDDCETWEADTFSERLINSGPCTCGRAELLATLEPPR